MIVSHKHKFVFVKTRKTAGTSLQCALSDHCDKYNDILWGENNWGVSNTPDPLYDYECEQTGYTSGREGKKENGRVKIWSHSPAWYILKRFPESIDYFWFTFERNPYDKLLSMWFYKREYQRRFGNNELDAFSDYAEKAYEEYLKGNDYDLYEMPSDWDYWNIEGKFVKSWKYENLTIAISELENMFNFKLEMPMHNFYGKRNDTAGYYGVREKKIINEVFSKELERFKYKL